MKITKIPKGNGKFRTIYCIEPDEKPAYIKLMMEVSELVEETESYKLGIIQGFVQGKNPVTNAYKHINFNYTLSFDLKDFFDTVTPQMVPPLVANSIGFVHNHIMYGQLHASPAQGLPSSPAIANLAACKMDMMIYKSLCKKINSKCFSYTRYADDLTISFNRQNKINFIKEIVECSVKYNDFILNEKKTHFQTSKGGRRIITGIGVDSEVHPTRKMKRKLRAAKFNLGTTSNEARGLSEWCSCKFPKEYKK